jgi:cysteine-rich repeat protein
MLQEGEICDDGNLISNDTCNQHCSGVCGDGIIQLGEECDDGNSIQTDGCLSSCVIMEMVLMQAGSFNMGSDVYSSEQPIHNVQITSDFYVGKTEVTVGQYRACVNAGVCTEPDHYDYSYCNWTSSVGAKENHPVNCVDWFQARTFAKWIGGDLLTEAQWEYVATAQGQAITYPWGNIEPTCEIVNFEYNCHGRTTPVCSKTGGNTAQGVCDMGGNVWEWVLDEWHDSYSGAPVNEQAWCSDMGICNTNTSAPRVIRGGSWSHDASYLRSALRSYGSPGGRDHGLGFRVSDLVH